MQFFEQELASLIERRPRVPILRGFCCANDVASAAFGETRLVNPARHNA